MISSSLRALARPTLSARRAPLANNRPTFHDFGRVDLPRIPAPQQVAIEQHSTSGWWGISPFSSSFLNVGSRPYSRSLKPGCRPSPITPSRGPAVADPTTRARPPRVPAAAGRASFPAEGPYTVSCVLPRTKKRLKRVRRRTPSLRARGISTNSRSGSIDFINLRRQQPR